MTELTGLRAARWGRESTRGQAERFGPEAQREQQDRAIESLGLLDTGLVWQVAHSGATVDRTPEWAEMLDAAGQRYDVLLVGYASRFARNVETFARTVRQLHESGASVYFCDERLWSADESHWDWWMREAVEAESYRRRLARRVREGYDAKWRKHADPGGRAPLGFRRRADPPRIVEIDPQTIGAAVRLFDRYALGDISTAEVAHLFGLHPDAVDDILANPIYNGWVRRRGEADRPAPWRDHPPVSDALWETVCRRRAARRWGGGPRRRIDPLAGLIHCASCGRYVKADGSVKGEPRRAHLDPCAGWSSGRWVRSRTYREPIEAQLSQLDLSDATLARVVGVLLSPPVGIDDMVQARADRQRKELAMQYATGRLPMDAFTAAVGALDQQIVVPSPQEPVSATEAVRALHHLAETWAASSDDPGLRSELIHSVYRRIEVNGPEITGVHLTPHAFELGLALALPEEVVLWRARPDSNRRSPA